MKITVLAVFNDGNKARKTYDDEDTRAGEMILALTTKLYQKELRAFEVVRHPDNEETKEAPKKKQSMGTDQSQKTPDRGQLVTA